MEVDDLLGAPASLRFKLDVHRDRIQSHMVYSDHFQQCRLHMEQVVTHWRAGGFTDLEIGVLVMNWYVAHARACAGCVDMVQPGASPVAVGQILAMHALSALPAPVELADWPT